jgi:hypothetical protein
MLTCFAAGPQQFVCLVAFFAGLAAFLTFWHLRGPQAPVVKHDDYWQAAWARVFAVLAMICAVGVGAGLIAWHRTGYRVTDATSVFVAREIIDPWRRQWHGGPPIVKNTFQATNQYQPAPVLAVVSAVLAAGAFGEYRYRRRQARLAREVLLGQG